MRRFFLFLPLALFLGMAVFLGLGLRGDPAFLPSELIDQPLPEIELPAIEGRTGEGLSTSDFDGQVVLLNVWGSWCLPCHVEHPMLMQIARSGRVALYGVNWRDDPQDALDFLEENGDPFLRVGADSEGRTAIELGVIAAPESFLIDRQGRIRHKHSGVITEEDWRDVLLPLIEALEAE